MAQEKKELRRRGRWRETGRRHREEGCVCKGMLRLGRGAERVATV